MSKLRGYCIVSRRFGCISRIDRPDWKEYMAKMHKPWSVEEGLEWVECLGDIGAEDHYRRVYSKDEVELGSYSKAKKYPKSHETLTGYVND